MSPVVRLAQGMGPPLFIQEGKVYAEGGDEIPKDQLPGWFHEQVKIMTPQARLEIGYRLPDDPRPRLPGEQEGEKFYLRDGKFYNEDGQEMPGMNLAKSEEKDQGITVNQWGIEIPYTGPIPEDQRSVPAGQPYGEVKMWTCPDCAVEMPLRKKGNHTVQENRKKKAG